MILIRSLDNMQRHTSTGPVGDDDLLVVFPALRLRLHHLHLIRGLKVRKNLKREQLSLVPVSE